MAKPGKAVAGEGPKAMNPSCIGTPITRRGLPAMGRGAGKPEMHIAFMAKIYGSEEVILRVSKH